MNKIVSAAILIPKEYIKPPEDYPYEKHDLILSMPPPARHGNVIHHLYFITNLNPPQEIQGFLDSEGNFLTREEAWKVAEKAGQILEETVNDPGELYSENLW